MLFFDASSPANDLHDIAVSESACVVVGTDFASLGNAFEQVFGLSLALEHVFALAFAFVVAELFVIVVALRILKCSTTEFYATHAVHVQVTHSGTGVGTCVHDGSVPAVVNALDFCHFW